MAFVVAVVITCCAAMLGMAHYALSQNVDEDVALAARDARTRAEDIVGKLGQRVAAYASIYVAHPDVLTALQSGDKTRLRETFERLFKQINGLDAVIGTFEITDAKGRVIMRGHNPGSFGDDKSKDPLVARALTGAHGDGLTVSKSSGEVSTDSVRPIIANGEKLGTLKLGARFRMDMAQEIKRIAGAEVVMIFGGKVNASTIGGVTALPEAASADAKERTVALQGHDYEMAPLHLAVEDSAPLEIALLVDKAPRLATLSSIEFGLTWKAGLLLLLLVPCVSYAARRAVRPIQELTVTMGTLAGGDLAVSVPHIARKDEIGAMAGAVDVFKQNALRVREFEASEQRSSAAQRQRAQSMAEVVAQVGVVVDRAARGDFGGRVAVQTEDAGLRTLVEGVNSINTVVDQATGDFAEVLHALAQGDLTRTVGRNYHGRLAELGEAIDDTVARLAQTVSTIQATAAEIGTAAREIRAGSQDLSQRTEQQASSLEETAATTEQLAASVKQASASSRHSVTQAQEASLIAEQGGSTASSAIEAMSRIETSSRKITEIISVIDEIAFQTNLLALNASVEAARAGEAGKGFAVVASEVRTLAQRSSDAAQDIKLLIGASGTEVAQGVALVNATGERLGQIVQAARALAANVTDIASAAAEQANGIDEMSQVVAHMDEMTQQNAALAEQSAASAAMMSEQTERLNALVGGFRVAPAAGADERWHRAA